MNNDSILFCLKYLSNLEINFLYVRSKSVAVFALVFCVCVTMLHPSLGSHTSNIILRFFGYLRQTAKSVCC